MTTISTILEKMLKHQPLTGDLYAEANHPFDCFYAETEQFKKWKSYLSKFSVYWKQENFVLGDAIYLIKFGDNSFARVANLNQVNFKLDFINLGCKNGK